MSYNYTEREVIVLDHAWDIGTDNVSTEDVLKTLNNPDEKDDDGVMTTATRSLSDSRKLSITYSFGSTLDHLEKPAIIEKITVEDT